MVQQRNNPVKVEVRWNEGLVEGILRATKAGAKNATKFIHKEIVKEFASAPWGSELGGRYKKKDVPPGMAKTVRHSPPGMTPYKQTGNLAHSIKIDFSTLKEDAEGRVYSDAPYAAELEAGGTLNTYSEKPHAVRNIVNPKPQSLKLQSRARPTFKKVFKRNEQKIFDILRSRIPFLTRIRVIFRS